VPKTLRPIFRDREDFSAGHSLTAQTLAALEASQFLIVICSPNAASSKYVNEEIRRFKTLGRTDRIIPVIVAGEPGDPARECFPPALRSRLDANGALTDEHEELIAADARPVGDGREIAKQKVVAGLLGLGLDEVVRRAERARRKRNLSWRALAGVFLLLAVAASGSAIYAYHKLLESEERLDQAIEIAYGFVTEATGMSDRVGVPMEITFGLLKRADAALTQLTERGADTPKLRYRRALMLLEFAGNYRALGRTDLQLARAEAAHKLIRELVQEEWNSPSTQRLSCYPTHSWVTPSVGKAILNRPLRNTLPRLELRNVLQREIQPQVLGRTWQFRARELAIFCGIKGTTVKQSVTIVRCWMYFSDCLPQIQQTAIP